MPHLLHPRNSYLLRSIWHDTCFYVAFLLPQSWLIPSQYSYESWDTLFMTMTLVSSGLCWGFLLYQIANSSRAGTIASSTQHSVWHIIGSWSCCWMNGWVTDWLYSSFVTLNWEPSLESGFTTRVTYNNQEILRADPDQRGGVFGQGSILTPQIMSLIYFSLSKTCICEMARPGPQSVASIRCQIPIVFIIITTTL